MSGLPLYIAQVFRGHSEINTTIDYKAIYPEEAINAPRAFRAADLAAAADNEDGTTIENSGEACA